MSLNKHRWKGFEPCCMNCGKKIHSNEHCIHWEGTKSDGSGYEDMYLHWLCALETIMIWQKDMRFAEYTEKYRISAIPRTQDPEHLKIRNWQDNK